MKSIEELIARQRIGETLARYCNHLDSMTLDDLGQLFTEDCAVSFGPNSNLEANGREALITSLARLWRWHRTAHHLCNVVISFDTIKKATVQSRVHAWHETRDGTEAEIFVDISSVALPDGFAEGYVIAVKGDLLEIDGKWVISANSIQTGCPSKYEAE